MKAHAPTPQGKSYELRAQNLPYILPIKVESTNIIIGIVKDKDIPKKKFECKKRYGELIKISKMCIPFESIEEIAGEFYLIFKDNKFKLQEKTDKIILTITFIINER